MGDMKAPLSPLQKSKAQSPLEDAPKLTFDSDIKIHRASEEFQDVKTKTVWISDAEIYLMRKQAKRMTKNMHLYCETDQESLRGLEIVESRAVEERNSRIRNHVKRVLKKQTEHADAEEIATVSKEITHMSTQKSIANAEYDAKEAKKILSQMRKEWRRAERKHKRAQRNQARSEESSPTRKPCLLNSPTRKSPRRGFRKSFRESMSRLTEWKI